MAQADSTTAAETNGNGANWTFMVYLDADNNLEEYYIDTFLNMSSVGSTSQVNIVVQMDRISGYDSRYGDWTDCKRFNVTKGLTPTSGNAIEDLVEVNMGDPDTLTDFVNWAISSFPASRYCLVLMDHGSGCVQSVCFDDTDGDELSLPELSQALSMVPVKMDMLYFDACVMGMIEVAHQIKDYADIMVGSEEVSYAGQPYDYYLSNLTANPSMSPSELADVIVSNYIEYTASNSLPSTMSGVNLSQVESLKTATGNLAQKLRNSENIYNDEIRRARGQAEGYMGPYGDMYGWYMDLYHFAQLIYKYIPEPSIRNDAEQMMTLLSNAVIAEGHYHHPNSHGLSIFFPCKKGSHYNDFMNEYSTTDFAKDTVWNEFIDYHVSNTPEKPDFVVVDVYWEPSKPMPGDEVTFYADLANQGTQDASSVSVRVYKDGYSYVSSGLDFPAGALKTIYIDPPWTATKGDHRIKWIMDEDDDFPDEWNETNNEMTNEFIVGYVLTVQTPYSNVKVWIDGYMYWTDSDGDFLTYVGPGSHDVEVQTPVSLDTGFQGVFVQWSDGDSSNPRTIFINNNLSLTAEYLTQYHLAVNRNPSYIGETRGEGWYESGSIATVNCTSPVPIGTNTRYVFVNWTGDAFGTSTTLQLVMDSPKTVTANYVKQYNVTFQQSGSGGFPNITIDDVSYPLPCSFWFDYGSTHNFSYESPVSGDPGVQYVVTHTSHISPFTVSYSTTITGYYKTQFYISITSSHGDPPPSQWVDNESSLKVSVESPTAIITNQTRWLCTGFSVDHADLQDGTSYRFSYVQEPHEIEFYWLQEFYISITSSHGDPPPSRWANSTESLSVNVRSPADVDEGVARYCCVGYRIDSGELQEGTSYVFTNIQDSYAISFEWQLQYYLTVETNPIDLSPEPNVSPPGFWYDDGMSVALEAGDVAGYTFDCWTVDGESQGFGVESITVEMEAPHTAISKYKIIKFPIDLTIVFGIIVISSVTCAIVFALKRRK